MAKYITILIFSAFLLSQAACVSINNDIEPALKGRERLITNDGNFLFYNSPLKADANQLKFIAFLNKEGGVIVEKFKKTNNGMERIDRYKVHDYHETTNRDIGQADDHAAPAIIHDTQNDRILLVTSYHGTDLFIYEYHEKYNDFSLFKVLQGRYTYPRLIEWHGNIYLFARLQPQGIKAGDLVVRASADDFATEQIVIPSVAGEVVYASRPAMCENGIYLTYSVLHYETMRLTGWKVIKYNPSTHQITEKRDLTDLLDKNYHSNRPTAIGYKDGQLLVGTAFFADKQNVSARFFSRKNMVLIAEKNLEKDRKFSVKERNIVKAPYYHTSISISEDLNWIYFDANKVYSSIDFKGGCFEHSYMMYPNLFKDAVFYAVVNGQSYEIRNFDNSIVRCAR
jgi:hypothetical protein